MKEIHQSLHSKTKACQGGSLRRGPGPRCKPVIFTYVYTCLRLPLTAVMTHHICSCMHIHIYRAKVIRDSFVCGMRGRLERGVQCAHGLLCVEYVLSSEWPIDR